MKNNLHNKALLYFQHCSITMDLYSCYCLDIELLLFRFAIFQNLKPDVRFLIRLGTNLFVDVSSIIIMAPTIIPNITLEDPYRWIFLGVSLLCLVFQALLIVFVSVTYCRKKESLRNSNYDENHPVVLFLVFKFVATVNSFFILMTIGLYLRQYGSILPRNRITTTVYPGWTSSTLSRVLTTTTTDKSTDFPPFWTTTPIINDPDDLPYYYLAMILFVIYAADFVIDFVQLSFIICSLVLFCCCITCAIYQEAEECMEKNCCGACLCAMLHGTLQSILDIITCKCCNEN